MRVAVIGSASNDGTVALVQNWRALGLDARLMSARTAVGALSPGDVAIVRLDVRTSLDGVEPGLLDVLRLERRGIEVLNPVDGMLAAHDKLRTARLLAAAHLPHPRTEHVRPGELPDAEPPVVLKPRFGSWGRDVALCRDGVQVKRYLARVTQRPWLRRHGLLQQEVVPTTGRDLRLLIAGGRVVGAIERVAAPGEWRTNVSCGGMPASIVPTDEARELAVTAAVVAGADLVGVDLIPRPDGTYVVLELNGAVDFDEDYSLPGSNVYAAAAHALGLDPVFVGRRREHDGDPLLV